MKSKKSKKELTSLILTALILGGGCLYGPVAEAEEIEIKNSNLPYGKVNSDFGYVRPKLDTDSLWINYNGSDKPYQFTNFAGGYSDSGDVLNRRIKLEKGTIANLLGGIINVGSAQGSITGNSVQMIGGSVNIVYGGLNFGEGVASSNEVEIENGTVLGGGEGSVYGGFASKGNAGSNSVTISGDETKITGNIYGGYSTSGSAGLNTITISGNGEISGSVIGGYGGGSSSLCIGNQIIINGGKFSSTNTTIWGGWVDHDGGRAGNNSIEINAPISVNAIYGGNVDSSTLTLGSTGIRVYSGGLSGLNKIIYNSNIGVASDKTVLSVSGSVSKPTGSSNYLDLDARYLLSQNTCGTMTLLTATNSLSGIRFLTSADSGYVMGTGSNQSRVQVLKSGTDRSETNKAINFQYKENVHTVYMPKSDGSIPSSTDAVNDKAIKYTIANNVNTATVASTAIDWSNGGVVRALTDDTFTFDSSTVFNPANLTFTATSITHNPLGESMTLLSRAKGITNGHISPLNNGKGVVNTSYTTNGIAFTGTVSGSVGVVDNAAETDASYKDVTYTLNNAKLSTVNLNEWDGTKVALTTQYNNTNLADNSIHVDKFKATTPLDSDKEILTAEKDGFFKDSQIEGDLKYSDGTKDYEYTDKGVTLNYKQGGGVKASLDGRKLLYYATLLNTKNITLGDNMVWGDGLTAPTGYNFSNLESIVATDLKFTNPLAVGTTTTLVSGASGLPANFANITGASHTQNFTDAAADNGVKLNGTINGTVSTTAGQVNYTVNSKSITGANLAGWDSTKSAFSLAGWTKGFTTGSINAAGFTAPDVKAGQSKDILIASNGFFSDDYITGSQKYGPLGTPSSDTEANVTFTGSQEKGVKASTDGTKLQYVAGNMAVSDITLGNMEVGAGGAVTKRTADANYTFNGSTTINATNLTFDKPADVVDSTLVSGATGITSSNPVTGADHSQAINNAAMGGGITVSGTLHGTVSADTGEVKYTVNDKTISSMDLSGWDTTTENTTLPNNKWTGNNVSVSTGTFTAPTADKTIFTTNIENFFGDVTGAMAYKSGAAFSGDADAGVTLSGTKSGGVKKSDDGKNLNFISELRTVNNISLGTMNWNTGRAITGNYDFSTVANNGVDASGLKFTFTGDTVNTISSSTPVWNLMTDATGLNGGLTVKGSPVSQTVSYGINNVANLSGTLTGNVNTANNTVQYNVTGKTLDKVDISNWDGSTTDTALNTSWSKKDSGISVIGSGFTAPTTVGDYDILTATSTGFFTGANIDSSIAYQTSGAYSETTNNITLSGTQAKGIKANDTGTALQYSFGKADIKAIKFGTVNYTKGGIWLDKSDGSTYTFSNLNSLDTTGFSMSMTDDQKKDARATDDFNMTLVKGTTDLPDIAAKDAGSSNYTYAATNGLTVGGTVSGSVSASNHDVLYKVTGNKATTLNITNVTWDPDPDNAYYNRDNSELDYKDAVVDSSNIFFSGVSNLSTGDVMTLISNYGNGITKTRGGIFTLENGKTGKGTAYYDGGVLKYKVTLGAGEIQPAVSATNNKAILIIPDGQEHQGTVTGGEAKGDGDSTGNEQGVKGKIVTNADGTGGDVNGGTSEEGDSKKNKADVEDSTIAGDVNGGKSENGNSTDNEAEVDHSNVGGDVNGGKTDGDGETKGNEANVKNGSKVTGNVTGGRSGGNGDCTGNAAEVEGSEVGGDVNGGQSDGNGNTRENKTHVKDSKVTGNVIGGHSGQNDGSGGNGESTGNTAEVEGSEVGGNVNGGRSEQGNANKNESTVSGGSKVTGDVTGGSSGGGGTANENKTTVEGGSHIGGNVTGGESNGGNTNKNETTVSGSTVENDVIGGKTSGNGTSNENKTHVDGSTIGGNVIGGQSENGNAEKNETTISGGSTVGGDVIGGKTTGTGNANENKVTLDGGSTVNGKIYGGYSENGDASGNDVNIGTGKINGDIYGGYSNNGTSSTANNTITLSSGADVSNSNIFGGSNGSAGNTLNIGTSTEAWSGGGQSVKNISNFETLNFSSVPWNNSNAALNISDGTASDLSMTTIQAPQVAFSGVKRLSSGSTMMFLNQSNVTPATNKATNLVAGSAFTLGTAMEGSGKLTLDADGNVVYLIENASVSEQTHNTVMAAEAAVLSINSGNDFINSATEGLAQKENVGTDGLATYAKIGGQSMKQDTGSHVKVNTWNAILALGHKNTKKQSAFEYGAFVEHGWGNFATHNNGLRGDGSAEYTGGGLLAKWKTNNGTYVEGSFRAGTVNEKANNLLRDAVQAYGYDERTSYAGFHIGVGKETVLKNGNLVDVYGKYFYNRKNGMNFNAGFDEYNIDAVTSQILRVGARYTVKSGSRWNYYGDLSYEHEFDGKATGRVNDMAIRGADISGGSLRMELGASLTPNDESPWEVDFNLTAYAGNKSGFTGGVSVKYAF